MAPKCSIGQRTAVGHLAGYLTSLVIWAQPRTADLAERTNDRPFLALVVLVTVQLKSGHSSIAVLAKRRHLSAGLLDRQVPRAGLLRNQASAASAGGLLFFESAKETKAN